MKKSTRSILLGIGFVTVLVGFFSLYRGEEFLDSLPAFVIGFGLIWSVYLEKEE